MAIPGPADVTLQRSSAQQSIARLAGAVGGYTTQLRYGDAVPARAREGLWRKYLDQADPEGRLPEAERERRAHQLVKLHMAKLALASVQARAHRKLSNASAT